MKKIAKGLLLVLALCALASFYFFRKTPSQTPLHLSRKGVFYVSVPVSKFSSIQTPCVDVLIEGKTFLMELDLGFRGDLTLTGKRIEDVSLKAFLRTQPMYGIQGKEYLTPIYSIPKIKIGDMAFKQISMQQHSEEFDKDSVFVKEGYTRSPSETGRVGWELFYNANLLLDMKNKKIAFCDSLRTLKNHGYAARVFVKTPLLLERGLIECDVEIAKGYLRCVLDTGASWNLLHTNIEKTKFSEQELWNTRNVFTHFLFKIGKKDLGPISFHCMPIRLPIPIDAILGMEFFQTHLVFIDFKGEMLYFSPY